MIKLTKTGDDSEFCNTVLLEQIHLFNEIYDIAIKLREDTGNLNIIVEEDNEEDKENNNNVDDEKRTNTKELIQETINKHNDTKTKKKEIKKEDDKYINKNHLTTNLRRGHPKDTEYDRTNRKELTKIDEYDSTNRRHQDIRLYSDYF